MRMDRAYLNKNAELAKKDMPADRQFISDPEQEDEVLADRTNAELNTTLFDSMF